jgi:hypothetical protein
MWVLSIVMVALSCMAGECITIKENANEDLRRDAHTDTHTRATNSSLTMALWPGCSTSGQFDHETHLYGLGHCFVQLCSCQEVRPKSAMWGLAARCDTIPGETINLIASIRRAAFGTPADLPEGTWFTDTEEEQEFATTMKRVMSQPKYVNRTIPVFEQVGIKLGYLNYSASAFRGQRGLGCMEIDGKSSSSLYEDFFNESVHTFSIELQGAFPLSKLWKVLKPTEIDQIMGGFLVSLGQSFELYEEAEVCQDDPGANHILFRQSDFKRGTPSAMMIDNDMILVWSNASTEEKVHYRRTMLLWFGLSVFAGCHECTPDLFSWQDTGCPPREGIACRDQPEERLEWARSALAELDQVTNLTNRCKGSEMLVETVVRPAYHCAAGDSDCPSLDAAFYTRKLETWANTYYGEPAAPA